MTPQLTRRDLAGLAIAAPFALGGAAPGVSSGALTFLGVGDWGRNGDEHQREVAARMGEVGAEIAARFVVSVGDNFYNDGVASADDPHWRTSFEDVYTAPALQVPWYVALGNHDYRGEPDAQVAYTAKSPRWRMPARKFLQGFTAPDGATLDLLVIDTPPLIEAYRGEPSMRVQGQDPQAELAWIDVQLAASRADWKIVAGHHPVYSGGSDHGSTPELIRELKPILERRGVAAYLFGHDHDLQHIEVGPVAYIGTGAGSRTRPTGAIAGTRFCSDKSGFTSFALTRARLNVGFHAWTGERLHQAEIKAPTVAA